MGSDDILIFGLSDKRTALLGQALSAAAVGTFSLRASRLQFGQATPQSLGDMTVIAVEESPAGLRKVLPVVQRLRAEEFYWEPVHLCAPETAQRESLEAEWAVYAHQMPPDVRALADALGDAVPLGRERRLELVRSALSLLIEDLNRLARALDPGSVVEPERVREAAGRVMRELQGRPEAGEFEFLRAELEEVCALPEVGGARLSAAIPLVVEAEAALRKRVKATPLLSALHTLNNVLRLAAHRPDDIDEAAHSVEARLRPIEERGRFELPAGLQEVVGEECASLTGLLADVRRGTPAEDIHERVARSASALYKVESALAPPPWPAAGAVPVERIVVVEDDADWRRLIVSVLRRMTAGGRVEVSEAATVAEAHPLLKDRRPALALIDLGLPADADSDLIPDAGLSLIKEFTRPDTSGKRFRHRFIILTAAENYTEAVHEALSLGVSPASYLQKNPATWESNLRAQVRLALQPPPASLPTIEVFKRTGRVARVEGIEVKLDLPLWSLLACLAESRRGRWCEPEKLSSILYWNYSLVPESRSDSTEALDPEERIRLQLPHYISDLRMKLEQAHVLATHGPPPADLLQFEEGSGYRLNANARVLGRVDEHFRIGKTPSVLVVEDDPSWGRQIVKELSRRGFRPRLARWLEEAHEAVESEPPDLVSLDLELPVTSEDWRLGRADDSNTAGFIRHLRQNFPYIPVAILTAVPWRDAAMLEILREGVRIDDYLSKGASNPFDRLAGSLARMWQEAVHQTRIMDWDSLTPLHPIAIDLDTGTLTSVAGHRISPTGKGRDILKFLSSTPNVFVSRSELIDLLYDDAKDSDDGPADPDKALNQHLKRLRKTITDATGGAIRGEEVICGERGIYWLRGMVQ